MRGTAVREKNMADRSVCTPLLAESDAQNNTTSTPNAASVTDKVINTKTDSSQVEGDKSDEELLKGLLTNDYCHVCEAMLLFESQRLSHYEGKRHAQKLKVYLQTKRAERMRKEFTGPQWTMSTDKDHFCEMCNMVFSSHVVAKSHYEGKVHAKNLRKQGLQPPDRYTEVRDPDDAVQKSAPDGGTEHHQNPAATTTTPSTEADLTDPNKYCSMCVAFFNNPQMALQHYNGRKHQRNQARQLLLKELGNEVQQADSLMCQMCSLQFNSVEMYQAHMQGSKHQIREKKVVDLCKSQQKDYNTFADELADYIQVQRARGIAPKAGEVLPVGDAPKEREEDEEEEAFTNIEVNTCLPNLPPPHLPNLPPPTSNPPHHSHPGCYYPAEGWRPPYQGPPWPPHDWDYNCPPPPVLPGSPLFPGQPTKRRRRRKQSSSSSYSTSSSYSSYSSSSSDSDERRREKRRIRRSRKERERRARDEDPDKEERKRKRPRREKDNEEEERRRGESGESEEERRRKKGKSHGKQRRREKRPREEDFEVEQVVDSLIPEDVMDSRKDTEVQIEAEVNVEQVGGGQEDAAKPKIRKEKKKPKEKVDTRTEEEKLWDDSILGC